MSTQTKSFEAYTIDSHPDPASVFEWVRNNWHDLYAWHDENKESLQAFCEYFGVTLKGWEISLCGHSFVTVDAEHWGTEYYNRELAGVRLWKYLNNNGYFTVLKKVFDKEKRRIVDTSERVSIFGQCHFTGYCMDETLLDVFAEFQKNPSRNTTMQDLMDEAGHRFVKSWLTDWEYAYSDETLRKNLECNEYYFYENGQLG